MITIPGICGSPIKDSNTGLLLREALKVVEQEEVQTEIFSLHRKEIEDCRQCNGCMAKQSADEFCQVNSKAGKHPDELGARR